jgi:hypothetical protein
MQQNATRDRALPVSHFGFGFGFGLVVVGLLCLEAVFVAIYLVFVFCAIRAVDV